MQLVELTGNEFCASHVKEKKKTPKVRYYSSTSFPIFPPKVLPPAGKLARLFHFHPRSGAKAPVLF